MLPCKLKSVVTRITSRVVRLDDILQKVKCLSTFAKHVAVTCTTGCNTRIIAFQLTMKHRSATSCEENVTRNSMPLGYSSFTILTRQRVTNKILVLCSFAFVETRNNLVHKIG